MDPRVVQLNRLMGSVRSLGGVPGLEAPEAARRVDAACLLVPARCPRCAGERFYRLGGERRRCAACRLTFRAFTGRWLARLRAAPRVWLSVVRCFALGLGAKEVLEVSGLSHPTVYRALETIRLALAWRDPAWKGAVASYLSGEDHGELFEVHRLDGAVRIAPRRAAEISGFPAVLHKDGFVYAEGGAEALVCHGTVEVPWNAGSDRTDLSTRDPFLIFLLNRLPRHFGVPRRAFPFYLKEQEFRYNTRGRPVEDEVLAALADFAPVAGRGA